MGRCRAKLFRDYVEFESKNPVFILDEIDKLGMDFRGDPAAALLEVLDPEQNDTFRDHYLDVPFNLSEVLFITTANVLDPIPPALRDRMEVLELPGYTEEEKLIIATDHLVGRQVPNHGLTTDQLQFTELALRTIIRGYTREAGVRNLEREIGTICRKVARRHAEGAEAPVEVTPDTIMEMLGAPKFLDEEVADRTKRPGVAIGLAWTPVGGDVLFVEATRMPGKGSLTLTGHLGEVMKESAKAALSWFRANVAGYDVDPAFYQDAEIPPSCSVWRDSERRTVSWRDDGDSFGIGADRTSGSTRSSDDGRNHLVRARAARWWDQGESTGSASARYSPRGVTQAEREGCQRGPQSRTQARGNGSLHFHDQ